MSDCHVLGIYMHICTCPVKYLQIQIFRKPLSARVFDKNLLIEDKVTIAAEVSDR